MSTLLIGLSIGVLFLGAMGLRRANDRASVTRWAPLLAIIAFGMVTTSAIFHLVQGGQASPTHDPISLALSWAATLALVAVALASPRADLTADRISRSFALVALFLSCAFVQRTELLAVLVAFSVLPLASRGRVVVLPIVGTAALSAGLFWLARAGVPLFRPHELAPPGAVALVLLGAWMRIGLFPFHGYVPVLFERSHPAKAAVAFVANPGMLILMRVLTESAWDLGISGKVLMVVAAISGLYAAFVCIGQSDLLRAIGFQAVASTSMIVAGLCSREEAGAFGAILHTAAAGLFITGLALVAWGVKARLGTSPGTATPGIASSAPHAAAAFLLFGLAAAGFPGTLGFVSEELLLHGVIEHHPVTGSLIVLTTALSAIAMLRLFFLVFYGAPNIRRGAAAFAPKVPLDLFPREKVAFGALLIVIFGLGVLPTPAISIVHSVTDNAALHHQQSGETP